MDILAVLAQLTGIIGWLLLVYSYYKDDIDKLLFVQIISSIFYCLSYFLLGAYSGLIVCFVELLKGIGYYKTDKDDLIFLFTLPIYILMAVFTYDGMISLLPVIGSIIDGLSLTKNKNIATIGSIISNILWLIYDIVLLAYATALTDAILVISNALLLFFGYSRLLKTNKLRIVQGRSFSKNIYSSIYKLDKKTYGEDYTWSFDYEKDVRSKNDDSLLIIKYNNEIVGYLSYLVLNELEYEKIINSSEIINNYDVDNIIKYRKNRKNYLIIDSINVKHEYQNHISINLIIKKLKSVIVKKYNNDYKIESIISIAINQFEKDVLEKAGFSLYKSYSNDEALYVIDNKMIEDLYLKDVKKKSDFKVYQNEKIRDEMLEDVKILYKNYFQDKDLPSFNKDSLIIVMYKDKLVGYLSYLVITKEKYDEMLNSTIKTNQVGLDEITVFRKNRKNYLTINSFIIDKKFQDGYVVKLLTRRFKKLLKRMNSNNYKISGINSVSITKDGKKFLEYLGFLKYKKVEDNNSLYLLDGDVLKKYLK